MIVYTNIEHDDHGVMSLESSDTYSDHGMWREHLPCTYDVIDCEFG